VTDTPAVVVADAGYWHQAQMENVINKGMQVLIPPDATKRKGARPGWDGGAYAFMRRVLETDHGGGLYRKRQGMIEPVFADTKFNRWIDRFQRRGRSACRSERRLITATHNLMKLFRHQMAPARGPQAPTRFESSSGHTHARRRPGNSAPSTQQPPPGAIVRAVGAVAIVSRPQEVGRGG